MKRILALLTALVIMLAVTGCKKESPYADIPNPIATITLEDGRQMRFELYVGKAPNTVANFVSLANTGYYDGMPFYRVLPGCFIQSGDAIGDGTGTPGYSIMGEFTANGFEGNDISHMRGAISMARLEDYDSAGSQFFILQGSYPEYDGKYAAFGKAMDAETLDVIDSVASVHVDVHQRPLEPVYIETIRVDTRGYDYTPVVIEEEKEEPDEEEESEEGSNG